jgi:hypothetical protein
MGCRGQSTPAGLDQKKRVFKSSDHFCFHGKNFFSWAGLGLGLMFLSLIFNVGCQFKRSGFSYSEELVIPIRKVVVLGFRNAALETRESGPVSSPVSGAVFMSGSVPEGVPHEMTGSILDMLEHYEKYELILPAQANRVYLSRLEHNKDVPFLKALKEIGNPFKADAILVGHIYRWQEREGSDFAAGTPASVAFDLYFIKPDDGIIMWQAQFDKTQQSLSENLLDVGMFFKGKGRWMTAEKLAGLGLKKMVDEMP